jgi:3-oxoadipate enol-lactonase
MEPGASVALTVYDRGEVSTVPRWYFQGLGSEHPVIWDSLIGELGETTDRHVGFDPRGIGASTGFPESFDQVVDDAVRVLDKLEIDEAQIVGQSLGGVFAMSFATRYPDRTHSLVVIDSVPKPDDNLREQADRRLALLSSGRSQEVIKRVAHFAFSEEFRANNPALMEDFAKMLGRQDPEVYAQYCRLGASTSVELDYPGPKLFVAGRDDRLTPPATVRAVAESVGGRFTEIPDASHNPQMEQPKLLADVIRLFTASD